MKKISKSNCVLLLIATLLACSCSASVLDIEGAFDEIEAKHVKICGFSKGTEKPLAGS